MRLALALALCALACAPRGAVDADDPRIRYEGRAVSDWRGRVRFAWPRTAMHLRFTGTGVTARIADLTTGEVRGADALSVQVDGGPARRVALADGTRDYVLAAGLTPGEHSLRVVKLTEAGVGTVRVHRVVPTAGALASRPAPRPRRLLAVGDSITAGYGVHQPDGPCGRDALAKGDASESWVSRAADILGAELHMVAWSGRGLTRNYDPDGEPTMAQLFDRAVPTERWSYYDLRAYVPDDVVINLGTNDAATPGFDDGAFRAALEALVARSQSLYPRARVTLAVGPLLHDDLPTPRCMSRLRVRAAADAVARARDGRPGRVSVLELPEAPPDEGCGCDHHPSPRTHARMAAQLALAIARGP